MFQRIYDGKINWPGKKGNANGNKGEGTDARIRARDR